MSRITLLVIVLLVTMFSSSPTRASQTSRIDALVAMEMSTPVVNVLYRYGQNTPAASGAYGPNTTAPRTAWFLEYQRAGATDVIDGTLRNDPALVATGLRMFHFGLAREAANGSFPGSAWPFHGTAFYLSEAGPALVILRAATIGAKYAPEVAWQVGQMQRAAYYMVRHVGGPGRIDDRSKNHRFFEAAIALGSTGILAGDHQLVNWSKVYARLAIGMARRDGVMPEDGGHDSGYQALGMINASRYLQLVATGGLHKTLYATLQRGEAWELSRVGPDGSVNQTGDTRTAGCKEHDPTGACKTVFYAPIFSSLAHWAAVSGDARYAAVSFKVWQRSGYGGH